MSRILIVFALLCAGLSILTLGSYASPNDEHQGANDSSVQQVNSVVQWNRTLLAIVPDAWSAAGYRGIRRGALRSCTQRSTTQ